VLLVERRPAYLPGDDSLRAYPPFAFGGPDDFGLVGESAGAWRLREDLAFAARSDRHVLLLGESGAGKELAARAIHALSRRAARPMVARNASTLPPGIVDAELFGSAKNYPNAGMPERAGLIGEADGTTLLLDEIGELPLEQQAHLLRVLDSDGEYQRLGEGRVRRSSFRLVAATNRSPDSLKSDFLARFAVRVVVPGLAQRREDIPLLTRLLLDRAADGQPELGERFFETRAGARAEPRVHPDLIDALVRHQFTTHTRELEHLLWTALSTSRDEFVALTEAVSSALALTGHPVAAPAPERTPEREEIVAALAAASGNVTNAARALGLSSRFVLYRLMRRHGLGAD
jgi:two-component system nitrogen regulation response regulator GlnG/two-component system response regulator HydG